MLRRCSVVLVLLTFVLSVRADDKPPRFRFTRGETLTYRVQQITSAVETLPNPKTNQAETSKTLTRLTLEKTWTVAETDAKGCTVLELRLLSMKLERESPNGEKDVFDSESGQDENSAQFKKLVGPLLARVQLDSRGEVVEVKESKYGPAWRFSADLPFKMVLPEQPANEGEKWKRDFAVRLDPPAGTGESYPCSQNYRLKPSTNGFVVIGVESSVKDPQPQPADSISLLPFLTQGDIYFDADAGRYHAARLKTERSVNNHQGDGTKYVYISTYAEDLVTKK